MTPDSLDVLRQALRLSPDNVPLRRHLAESLAGLGELDEAEQEFRRALAIAADDPHLKLGLAKVFFQQGKLSQALVVVEDLTKRSDAPPAALLLHARLLDRTGDMERAARQYRAAVKAEPSLADAELAARLDEDEEEVEAEPADEWSAEPEEEPHPGDRPLEKPTITFQDVGGMAVLKEEIRLKIIAPMTHPEIYEAYGKAAGGGLLMFGPPGCGKTHLARATAGEVHARFLIVGIHDVLDSYVGSSEKNIHAMFDQARRHRPCILFFDEVDALAASRSDMKHSFHRGMINQFLAELDGVKASNDGVLILAATNTPWHLDPAFRRPGRFDRILFVPPPDAAARSAILRILLKGKPVKDVDVEQLAKRTDQFSGADLKGIVDRAIEAKLRQALKDGQPKPLTTKDLLAALANIRPSTEEWFAIARNYALYANQGGAYDDIFKYLEMK